MTRPTRGGTLPALPEESWAAIGLSGLVGTGLAVLSQTDGRVTGGSLGWLLLGTLVQAVIALRVLEARRIFERSVVNQVLLLSFLFSTSLAMIGFPYFWHMSAMLMPLLYSPILLPTMLFVGWRLMPWNERRLRGTGWPFGLGTEEREAPLVRIIWATLLGVGAHAALANLYQVLGFEQSLKDLPELAGYSMMLTLLAVPGMVAGGAVEVGGRVADKSFRLALGLTLLMSVVLEQAQRPDSLPMQVVQLPGHALLILFGGYTARWVRWLFAVRAPQATEAVTYE